MNLDTKLDAENRASCHLRRSRDQRLADGGHLVLQPDLYYRVGATRPKVVSEVLGNPKSMEELMKWVNSLDRNRKVSDSGAFIEFLSSRPDVKGKRFGAGYCMAETYISPSGIGLQFLTNLSERARQIRLAQLLGM